MVKVVIIGMGRMGKTRYRAMKEHGGYIILALCDIETISDEFCEKKYRDWKQCIIENQPDAVMICTVNSLIPEIVCFALQNHCHVFSEKPPGRTLEDTVLMKNCYQRHTNKVLKFGFNHRYHNSIIEAKSLLDSGVLGDVVCARGIYGKAGCLDFPNEWRNNPKVSGGGILIDQGIHMIDLLRYFIGDFVAIQSSVDNLVWKDIETEDSAFAIMKTEDGKVASLHSSSIQWKHKFDLDILCTRGVIGLNGLLTSTHSYGEEKITYYFKDLEQKSGKIGNPKEYTMCFDSDNSWNIEMEEFFDAIDKHKIIKNGTIEDAVQVMKIVSMLYNSFN